MAWKQIPERDTGLGSLQADPMRLTFTVVEAVSPLETFNRPRWGSREKSGCKAFADSRNGVKIQGNIMNYPMDQTKVSLFDLNFVFVSSLKVLTLSTVPNNADNNACYCKNVGYSHETTFL